MSKDEKKGDVPALACKELALWPTKEGSKVDFTGLMGKDRVVAIIRENEGTKKKFISVAIAEGAGDTTAFTQVAKANPVNTINGEPVAEGKVRYMVADAGVGEDGEPATFHLFVRKGMTEELFRKMGFEGPLVAFDPAEHAKEKDRKASVPRG